MGPENELTNSPIAGVSSRLVFLAMAQDSARSEPEISRRTAWIGAAVFWMSAIDDLLTDANPKTGELPGYRERRNNDDGGRTVQGLCLARNEIAHGNALTVSQGLTFPMTFPINLGGLFVPSSDIEEGYSLRGRKLRPRDLESYERFVAGREATAVIATATEWLNLWV